MILEEFNSWWQANSEEKMEFGEDPYGINQAIDVYCELFNVNRQELYKELKKPVDNMF